MHARAELHCEYVSLAPRSRTRLGERIYRGIEDLLAGVFSLGLGRRGCGGRVSLVAVAANRDRVTRRQFRRRVSPLDRGTVTRRVCTPC
jgi:hypothetical protein